MSSPRIIHGSLRHFGLAPSAGEIDPEADWLLLDGGPLWSAPWDDPLTGVDRAFAELSSALYLSPSLQIAATLQGELPRRAVTVAAHRLTASGNAQLPIAIIQGSHVAEHLEEFLLAGQSLRHAASDAKFTEVHQRVLNAVLECPTDVVAAAMARARVVLLSSAPSQTLEQATSGKPADGPERLALHIQFDDGYRASATLAGEGDSSAAALETIAANANEAADKPLPQIQVEVFRGADNQTLGLFTCQDKNLSSCQVAISRLLHLAEQAPQLQQLSQAPPHASSAWTSWPTSIQSDLVEWTIDVRRAQDWLDSPTPDP